LSTLYTTRRTPATANRALAEPAAIVLTHPQRQALSTILSLLEQAGPRRAIGLFGPAGSGKTALLNELGKGALRTPQNRIVICSVLDVARLSASPAPWQQLILHTLESLDALAGAPPIVRQLRAELEALVQHEANHDETATLAAAAFAHRLRSSFAGILSKAVLSAGGTIVIAINHLETAPAYAIAQLLEASQYFLIGQGCSVLICADEARLIRALDRADLLDRWLTARVSLPARREQAPAGVAAQKPAALPPACARLFAEVLGSDYYAIERAGDQWWRASQALSEHRAAGHTIPVPAEALAKLCALKGVSPMLFDAACLDPALLLHLERQAKGRGAIGAGPNGWSEVLARDPRLVRLFAGEPPLAGIHASYLLAALRLIQTGSSEALHALPREAEASREGHSPQASPRLRWPTLATLPALIAAGLLSFGIDRLAKQIALAQSPALAGGPDLLRTSLGVGTELAGLALCLLLAPFALKPTERLRRWALGLLSGGLASLLVDRLTLGAPANHLRIAQLPAFSLAHLALVVGAVALIAAIARSIIAGKSERE